MATSGSITGTAKAGGSVASNYTFWAEWKRNGDPNVTNNTSSITVSLIIQKTSGNALGAYNLDKYPTVSLSVNGSAKTPTIVYIDTRDYKKCIFATWTGNVTHKDDGSLSCPIVASFTHYGSDSLDSGSLSGNAVLDTIPRASVPTVSASSVQMGKAVTITTNRKASSFTHTLTYSFGGSTGTIATGVGASYAWTVPDLASKISGSTSGTCTITCQTYSGSTLFGSKTVTITLKVQDKTTPTVSAATVQMGKSVTIYTNRNSSAYTHKITYAMGNSIGTIASSATTSTEWTPRKTLAAGTGNKTSVSCTITCETYNGAALVGSATVTITLTVPDATEHTLSATSVVMGNPITISTPRETDAYTHDLTYSIAGATGTIATDIATSYTWPVPLSLASYVPNDTSATITVTCATKFKGSSVVVGTNTKTFIATVPNDASTQPGFTMSLSCIHDLPSQFAGIYVEGKSKVQVSYSASSLYSSIASCETTVQGVTGTDNPFTSAVLSPHGSVAVAGTVTDTRGFITQKTSYIDVVPYSRPRVAAGQGENKIVCVRCNSEGTADAKGTNLLLKVGRKYSKVESGGVQKNYCKLSYRYKTDADDESGYSELVTLLEPSASSDYVSEIIPNVVPNVGIAYTIQIIVEDDVGEKEIITVAIPTSFVTAHAPEGGHGFTLGGYHDPEKVDVFDCWFDAQFRGEILIGDTGMTLRDYILSVISEGG